MKPLIVLIFSLTASVVSADPKKAAMHAVEMFSERCAGQLLDDLPANSTGLSKMPRDVALFMEEHSDGRVWMSRDYHLSLREFTNNSGEFRGCSVRWESTRRSQNRGKIDIDTVVREFELWAKTEISSSLYVSIAHCNELPQKYQYTLESKVPRKRPVRVFLHVFAELELVMLAAAETVVGAKFYGCHK